MHAIAAHNTGGFDPAFDPGRRPRMAEFLYGISGALLLLPEFGGPWLPLRPSGARRSKSVRTDESGATIIEYSMFLALIALAVAGAFQFMGDAVGGMYGTIATVFVASVH